MDFSLACTDGDGGDSMFVEPVRIQPAIGKERVGLDAQRLQRLGGAFHDRAVLREFERRVGGLVAERYFRRLALVVLDLPFRLRKGIAITLGDLQCEGRLWA